MPGKINASLDNALKKVKWGEYRIGDIFDKLNVKKAKKINVRKFKNSEFNTPVVYCKYGDNGIMYWGRKGEFTTFNNVISIVYNGAIAAGKVYAQKDETGILAESYFIRLKNYSATHNINLFLASILEKKLYPKYSRDYLATWDGKVENDTISLPIRNENIDFDFMEEFIQKLTENNLYILSNYLQSHQIVDYNLTIEEEKAIKTFSEVKWEFYNLEKLFGKSTRGKRLKSEDRISGTLPFVTAGETDEGISDFIGNPVHIFSNNTTTIDMFGSAKYRNYKYGGDDHIAVVHTENLPKNVAIFITTAIHHASHNGQFDYGRNFYAKDADALDILLPTKNGKIDYDYMEIFISAIKKLVTRQLIDYSNNQIPNHNFNESLKVAEDSEDYKSE